MSKKDDAEQVDSQQQQEPSQDTNQLNQEVKDPNAEDKVVNNGDVTDPGNSGLIGDAFTEGNVTGNADKPNG